MYGIYTHIWLFRNNPSSHWMRCLTTTYRHLAKKLHPDKPGGSAAQMEELKYAYDYLQGIVQQWIAVLDWTRCQVQCHCTLCLCLYRDKVGQCPKCFEKYGHKRGHKNCGFSKDTSYFLRFHKDDPQGKGLYWKEIAHGSTEEEAKMHVDSERLKEKGKAGHQGQNGRGKRERSKSCKLRMLSTKRCRPKCSRPSKRHAKNGSKRILPWLKASKPWFSCRYIYQSHGFYGFCSLLAPQIDRSQIGASPGTAGGCCCSTGEIF